MKILKTANYKKAQWDNRMDRDAPDYEQTQSNINDDMVPKDSWGGLSGVDHQQIVNLVKNGTPIREAIYQVKPDFNEEKFDVVSRAISKSTSYKQPFDMGM